MELIKIDDNNYDFSKMIIALGDFDGLHLAHKTLINKMQEEAKQKNLKTAILHFSIHPDYFLKKREFSGYLTLQNEKMALLNNVDYLVELEFTKEVSKMTKDNFYNNYLKKFHTLVMGYDFRFGDNGSGDSNYLKDVHKNVIVVPRIENKNGEKLSSELIRSAIKKGLIKDANQMLGYNYFLEGRVIHGDGLGKKIGFPTANINVSSDKFIPKEGVYLVKSIINDQTYYGLLNIGHNKNINYDEKLRFEIYYQGLDFSLYDKIKKSLGD